MSHFLISNLEDAARFAAEKKDAEALQYILTKCGPANRMLADKVRGMMTQIK